MTDIEKINQAFLQLSFSIKNMCYFDFEPRRIDKDVFDSEILIRDEMLHFPAGEFDTYDESVGATENEVKIITGFTTLVIESAIENIKNEQLNSDERDLVDLLYMIRCSYAHESINPKWQIKAEKYKRKIKIEDLNIDIDFSNKDGELCDLKDIGGYENYYKLKNKIITLLGSILTGVLSCFEQHVFMRAARYPLKTMLAASEQKPQATFSSVGKMERCCEKAGQGRQYIQK